MINMDPEISEQSHEHIFQIYNQLKSVLPKNILKIKVLKNQRYPIIRHSLMKEIEKDMVTKNKNYLSSSQKINIFFNENPEKKDKIKNLIKHSKINALKNNIEKQNIPEKKNLIVVNSNKNSPLHENNEIITYNNFREKNMKILGVNCDSKLRRTKGMYNSFSVNDYDLKKNIYLPRIIDRMKYNVPRNLRNYQGFIVLGVNAKNNFDKEKEKEIALKKNKGKPDDLLFSKLKKISIRNEISKNKVDINNVINSSSDKIDDYQIIKAKA